MRIVVISHGEFSKGIINSVQMLVGKQENLVAYGLYPEQGREVLQEQIRQELENGKASNEDILILSDIFHGTPFNVTVELMEEYSFYHVTGINLPLLVQAIMDRMMGENIQTICDKMVSDAAVTVVDVNKMLAEEIELDEEDAL